MNFYAHFANNYVETYADPKICALRPATRSQKEKPPKGRVGSFSFLVTQNWATAKGFLRGDYSPRGEATQDSSPPTEKRDTRFSSVLTTSPASTICFSRAEHF